MNNMELKVVKFEPEFISKLNFYCNAVNHLMKSDEDKNSIGLLICKEKNDVVAQWSLENSNEPIGISTYDLQNVLPSEKEIAENISYREEHITLSNSVFNAMEFNSILAGLNTKSFK